jgi:hypothetical protein
VTLAVLDRDHDGRRAEAIDQPRRDDPDNAAVPAFARDHDAAADVLAVHVVRLRDRFLRNAALDRLALLIDLLDARREHARFADAARGQEPQRYLRIAEAARCVEPRSQSERDVDPTDRSASADARRFAQRENARPRPLGSDPQKTGAREPAIVPVERSDVGNRAERDQIEPRPQIDRRSDRRAHRGADGKREPSAAQALVRKTAVVAMRIQECERRKRLVRHEMMVDDDDVDPDRVRGRDALVIARAAIARHDQRRARLERARQRRMRKTVSAFEAVGDQGAHVGAEERENAAEDRRARRAIDVVVAEDDDALARPHRAGQALGRDVAIDHRIGRREPGELGVEEIAALFHIGNASMQEHLRNGRADTERTPELAGRRCIRVTQMEARSILRSDRALPGLHRSAP